MENTEHPAIPENYRYKKVFEKGRPVHDPDDPFRIRHPKMDLSKRARIFAPFDALRGFDAALDSQNPLHL